MSGCGQQLVEFIDLSAGAQDMAIEPGDMASSPHDLAVGDLATRDIGIGLLHDLSAAANPDLMTDDAGFLSPPEIISTNPADGASSLCIPTGIEAVFDKDMDPLTLTPANFKLTGPGMTAVNGSVSYDDRTRTATFLPSNPLTSGNYKATVTTNVRDAAGIPLSNAKVWTFTTNNTNCLQPVNLRSLSNFVAVAGAGLTNTNSNGITVLNGDVGLAPDATCLGDGTPCSAIDPTINGTLYANDPAGKAAAAKADLVSAYNDAHGRPAGTLVTANLAGQILFPGVYTSPPLSSMDLAVNGTLTLDAQGDQNAVWIFQIGSTLTANTGSEVKLINGAKAANVFWAVGSASTINANVKFAGNVLAQTANSVGSGAVVNGRLLCSMAGITLMSDTINLP